MEEIKLDVQIRSEVGSRRIKSLRRKDFVPAIVYGEESDPTLIKVQRGEFEKVMRHHRGQSVLFHLNILDGEKKLRDYSAIVKEEQHHPVKDDLVHIDFQRISLKEKLEVKVPLEITGDAVGVKKGGTVDHLWEIAVYCLPIDIPEKIVVDVSALDIGEAIHLKDLTLPSGVEAAEEDDSIVIASVVAPMREEEAAEEPSAAEPELIKKEKKAEAEEESGASEKEEK